MKTPFKKNKAVEQQLFNFQKEITFFSHSIAHSDKNYF